MSEYEYDGITKPEECVRLVFEDVLRRTHLSTADHNRIVEAMNNENNRWEATYFLQGPESGIRSLLSESLYQKTIKPGMESRFIIKLSTDQIVSIYTAHNSGFHPQAVWRADDKYFMLDYEDYMAPLSLFAISNGVTREPLFFAERQQKLAQKWRDRNGQIHCERCNRNFTPEDVKATISESGGKLYIVFSCPQCRGVPRIASAL